MTSRSDAARFFMFGKIIRYSRINEPFPCSTEERAAGLMRRVPIFKTGYYLFLPVGGFGNH